MTKMTKIWLWCALLLSAATTIMNGALGRWLSVGIAAAALAGLCALLFRRVKWGFLLMCACYLLAFVNGVYQGVSEGTGMFLSVLMSFVGSALIPGITFLFLRRQWGSLR